MNKLDSFLHNHPRRQRIADVIIWAAMIAGAVLLWYYADYGGTVHFQLPDPMRF